MIRINNGSLQFHNTTEQDYEYRIVNVLGQIVDKGNTNKGTKDVSYLQTGAYHIRMTSPDNKTNYHDKFIVQ